MRRRLNQIREAYEEESEDVNRRLAAASIMAMTGIIDLALNEQMSKTDGSSSYKDYHVYEVILSFSCFALVAAAVTTASAINVIRNRVQEVDGAVQPLRAARVDDQAILVQEDTENPMVTKSFVDGLTIGISSGNQRAS